MFSGRRDDGPDFGEDVLKFNCKLKPIECLTLIGTEGSVPSKMYALQQAHGKIPATWSAIAGHSNEGENGSYSCSRLSLR